MLSSISLLAILAAAMFFILGINHQARRLLLFGLALACLAPFILSALASAGPELWSVIIILLPLVVIWLFIAGWLQYTGRRRRLDQWRGNRSTSLKRRVDRD